MKRPKVACAKLPIFFSFIIFSNSAAPKSSSFVVENLRATSTFYLKFDSIIQPNQYT
jgi:hypothetical protein